MGNANTDQESKKIRKLLIIFKPSQVHQTSEVPNGILKDAWDPLIRIATGTAGMDELLTSTGT